MKDLNVGENSLFVLFLLTHIKSSKKNVKIFLFLYKQNLYFYFLVKSSSILNL